jgi:hypothetical protein
LSDDFDNAKRRAQHVARMSAGVGATVLFIDRVDVDAGAAEFPAVVAPAGSWALDRRDPN